LVKDVQDGYRLEGMTWSRMSGSGHSMDRVVDAERLCAVKAGSAWQPLSNQNRPMRMKIEINRYGRVGLFIIRTGYMELQDNFHDEIGLMVITHHEPVCTGLVEAHFFIESDGVGV